MQCPINQNNCHELVEKYPFLSSINVECVEKNKTQVYMDATIVLETTPLPETFYEFKYDVYSIVKQKTNKTPVLRSGWKIQKFQNS